MSADYEKMLRFMIGYFAEVEGTDYLDIKGRPESHPEPTEEENAELTRIRDEVRKAIGWHGY